MRGVIYVKVNKFKNTHKFEIPERPRSCFKFVQTEKKSAVFYFRGRNVLHYR